MDQLAEFSKRLYKSLSDPKSARELLLLLLKLFREEKKELEESDEAIKTLSGKSNKKQPDLKKQTTLGEG